MKHFTWTLVVLGILSSANARAYQINDRLNVGFTGFLNAMYATGDHFDASKVGAAQAAANAGYADGLRLSRAYLTVIGKATDSVWGRITLDENYSDPTVENGRGGVFVKYLYAAYTPIKTLEIKLGLVETPWISYEDSVWTYRFLARTGPDYEGLATSADYGVSVAGSLLNNLIEYHVLVSDGEGYQNPQNGRGFALGARVGFNVGPFALDVFGYDESMHNGVTDYNPKRAIAMLVYDFRDILRAAGEYMIADDHITPQDRSVASFENGTGYSLFGFLRLPVEKAVRIFGRYLFMDPDRDNAYMPVSGVVSPGTSIDGPIYGTSLLGALTGTQNTWAIAGVSYDVTKDVIIALDYNGYTVKTYDLSERQATFADNAAALNLQVAF